MSEGNNAPEASPTPAASLQQEIERLREALARRDDFLALTAHELRNPMHALSLQVSAARMAAQAAGATEVALQLARTQQTLSRYIARATSLLDLIRLGAHDYPLNPQPLDLSELLGRIAESLRAESRYHGAAMRMELPAICAAHTDPAALEHIVGNLLSNAFKHSCGTEVHLRLQPQPPDHALITVADNGRGVCTQDRERIFGKFERGNAKSTTGTGLGLWLSQQLAESLGGELRLDEQHHPGAAFMLRIPLTLNPSAR